MRCIILGSGGSNGVPEINCHCYTCSSDNPKNKRLRASIYVGSETTKILVDTSPDLRQQSLNNKLSCVDAVLYTHDHSDHVMGIDDIKLLCKNKKAIPAYMSQVTYNSIYNKFRYMFDQLADLYPAKLIPKLIDDYTELKIGDIEILSFLQHHDNNINSLGFKFGNLAYSTDLNALPEKSIKLLYGVEHWIIDCQKYHWVPSHLYIESIFDLLAKIKPKNVYLTHMNHSIEYDEIKKMLPKNIQPSFDGMTINF